MKIDLITPQTYDSRVLPWYDKAVNTPNVHRWYAFSTMVSPPARYDTDWAGALYMDDANKGVMALSMDRHSNDLSVGMWVLEEDSQVAAALMRYFVNVLVPRYQARSISFAIAETNLAWVSKMEALASAYLWGKEPDGLYDSHLGRWVRAIKFKVLIKPGDNTELKRILLEHARRKASRHVNRANTP